MELIVYVLTGLAGLVVVLTRVRLSRENAAGRARTGQGWLRLHTVAGASAFVLWVVFLAFPEDSALGSGLVGIIGLFFWWWVVIAGLAVLMRWLPARGRHAGGVRHDNWSTGPGLSLLAHVGMLFGVAFLTWAYLIRAV